MAEMKMPRFMISATGSGCGKTTLLNLLIGRNNIDEKRNEKLVDIRLAKYKILHYIKMRNE